MKNIACCHIPTKIMLVDDDPIFLKSLSLKLRRNRAVEQFDNSYKAATKLQNIEPKSSLFAQIASYEEESKKDKRAINFDIGKLAQLIYDPRRFDALGILMVDYTMPGLNGIELCQKCPEPTKCILLTGDADERIAVDAFNKGLIHRYIKKDSSNTTDLLEQAIEELELQYFHDISDEIITHLQQDVEHPLECFNNPQFNTFIQEQFEKNKIVEHYLIDTRGSLLGLDSSGHGIVIAVRDVDDMHSALQIAELADEIVPKTILQNTASLDYLLFTGEKDDFSIPVSQWKDHLYPVNFVENNNKFYASVINAMPKTIDLKKLTSFDSYLEKFYKQIQ